MAYSGMTNEAEIVQPQPVPMTVGLNGCELTDPDGGTRKGIQVTIASPTGAFVAFWDLEFADNIALLISQAVQQARTGLVIAGAADIEKAENILRLQPKEQGNRKQRRRHR